MAHKRNSVEVPELEKLLAGKKKKYVRYEEGAVLYSMGKNSFRQVAQDAHAIVRLKRIALVNVEVLDEYLECTACAERGDGALSFAWLRPWKNGRLED